MTLVSVVIGCVALAVFAQFVFSFVLMLYAWDEPERLGATSGPPVFRDPELAFTVLLAARSEEEVIAETIVRLREASYPRELLEIIVICQEDDHGTIAAARRQIQALGGEGLRLEIYGHPPFNKPHALMAGYAVASHEVVAVFDAEDDVHPDIFGVINTVMLERQVGVVQGGVQLMNLADHWFSALNCLEYFFYYRSRMHFNARVGMIPLGGNTVFIRRELIDRVGGWDTRCLTEDADIGIRISALGESVSVVYDSSWVTREETPHSVRQLVRQRTRWQQGFLQILVRGTWLRIPGWRRRMLAFVTLAQPILDVLLFFYVVMVALLVLLRLPVLVTILTVLPLYGIVLQMTVYLAGSVMFGRCFDQRVPLRVKLLMPLVFLPFQWLIGFSALRASIRLLLGRREWQKTEHRGAHRGAWPQLRVAHVAPGALVQREPPA